MRKYQGLSKTFVHTSVLPATVLQVQDFHSSSKAFRQLAMPPMVIQINRDSRASLTEGEMDFTIWMGPIPVRWVAAHAPGPISTSFKDVQLSGPMESWEHAHIFESVTGGARLTDHITFAHKPGWRGLLTRLFFDGLPLRMLFLYRHWRTRRVLAKKPQIREIQSLGG